MDQNHGALETGQLERARDAGEPKPQVWRQIAESALRLHVLAEPEKLLPVAADVLRQIIGPCTGIIALKLESLDVRHPFGGREADAANAASINLVLTKAMESGQTVVDGQGPGRAVAIPLQADARQIGALYVANAEFERRFGASYLEVLMPLGKHVAAAFANALRAGGAAGGAEAAGEEAVPPGLSLSESKRAFERRLVRARLRDARGNIASAARSLGMDRGQLSRLLKKHGVDKNLFRPGGSKPR